MLELSGFKVTREVLDPAAFGQKTYLRHLDKPPEQQPWDIAMSYFDVENFSMFHFYHHFVLDGFSDWTLETPRLNGCMTRS